MLVLTRKSGQKLIIGNDIEVIILETKGDAVKIGINAPKSVSVFREEVYQEIKKANELANQAVLPAALDQAMSILDKKATKKLPDQKLPE
jgi:carbon storage regulator